MMKNLVASLVLCLFCFVSAYAQEPGVGLSKKLVADIPVRQIRETCVFHAPDSLSGFDFDAYIHRAIQNSDIYAELRITLYHAQNDFISHKYHLVHHHASAPGIQIPLQVTSSCNNVDFELGDYTGWTGGVGSNQNSNMPVTVATNTIWTQGINSDLFVRSYHTIMTPAGGNDFYGNFPVVPSGGGNFSVRLGNQGTNVNEGGDCAGTYSYNSLGWPHGGAEVLQQTFGVSAANALFSFKFAAVLNDGGHSLGNQPYFSVQVYDQSNTPISCLSYRFELQASTVPPGGVLSSKKVCWYASNPSGWQVYYIPWQSKFFDLTPYIGQNVTVKFSASGCVDGGHFGYAYFDASCGPKALAQSGGSGCAGPVVLTAPTNYGNTYTWSGSGITASAANNATVSAAGNYSVTIGTGPCAITLTTNVAFSNPAITAAPSNQSVCSGGGIAGVPFTMAPAGTTVNWTNSNTNVGLSATGNGSISPYTAPTVTSPQTAIITATPSYGGCNGPARTFTITVNPYPALSNGGNKTITCANPTVAITGSSAPGGSYAWTGPATGSPAGSAPSATSTAVTVPGVYTLTANYAGCIGTTTVSVGSNIATPSLSVIAGQTVSCASNTVNLNGSSPVPGAGYSWTGPAAGAPAGSTPTGTSTSVSGGGTYTLTVTDPANGCKTSSVVAVASNTQSPQLSALQAASLTCSTQTVILSGSSSSPGATYAWTGPVVGAPAGSAPAASSTSVSANGVYTLTVTDPSNGCTSSTLVAVSSNTVPPVLNAMTSPTITCSNATVSLNGSSSTPGVSYSWTGPAAGNPAGSTPGSASTDVNNAGSYTLTVFDATNSCSNTAVVTVSTNTTVPQLSTGSSPTITCASATVTISGSSPTPGATYSWMGPTAGMPAGTTPTAAATDVSQAGSYTVTVTDPVNGCQQTQTLIVQLSASFPQLDAIPDQTLTCSTQSVTLNGSSSTSGATYSWTPGGPGASTTVLTTGIYTLTVTDPSNGCAVSQTVTVATNTTQPTITATSINGNTITCAQSSLSYSAVASGATVSWTGPQGPLSGNPVSITTAGSYTATATDLVNGCTATYTVAVSNNTIAPSATTGSSSDSLDCANPTVALVANSGGSNVGYSWSGPGGYTSSQQNPGGIQTPGVYTLTVTDASNGCISTATIAIAQGTNPAVSFTANPTSGTAPLPVNFTNTSGPGFNGFSWDLGNQSTSVQMHASTIYTNAGTYTVVLVGYAANPACNDTATMLIVVDEEDLLEIPNVFTPNDDQTNDLFHIKSRGYVELHVDIFNRWGQLLGVLDGLNATWDGKGQNGNPVPDGTYFYLLKARTASGKTVEKQGTVTMFR